MDYDRKLAHIIAYYLSRFDKQAVLNLGFKTDKEAFTEVAKTLGLLPNYIKFRRDEFDVVHPHRLGWYKREMSPSIATTIHGFEQMDEPTLRGIVKDILKHRKEKEITDDLDRLVTVLPTESSKDKKKAQRFFIPRNITGRKAEEFFMEWIAGGGVDFLEMSEVFDKRDNGCGYDFEGITSLGEIYYFEVKGLSASDGGIMFTGKEWEMAQLKGSNYFLVIVSNIGSEPVINIIADPAGNADARKSFISTIQVVWNIDKKQIKSLIKD